MFFALKPEQPSKLGSTKAGQMGQASLVLQERRKGSRLSPPLPPNAIQKLMNNPPFTGTFAPVM